MIWLKKRVNRTKIKDIKILIEQAKNENNNNDDNHDELTKKDFYKKAKKIERYW